MILADANEREQALDTTQSFIVQAPAGSGKTELLIRRMLKLFSQIQPPQTILALTFTRKAAEEMSARIMTALNTTSIPPSFKIMTLDAFCNYLVTAMPIKAKWFQATPSETPQLHYQEAGARLLQDLDEAVPWQPALFTLLRHYDNRRTQLITLLSAMLAKREQWLAPVLAHQGQDLSHLNQSLALLRSEKIAHALKLGGPLLERALHLSQGNWSACLEMLLTVKGTFRQRLQSELKTLDPIPGLEEALLAIKALPLEGFDANSLKIIQALFEVLPVLTGYLKLIFAREKQVDFIELNLSALDALGDDLHPTDLALSLDARIHHVLVDEFQDTSELQYQLLLRLTRGFGSERTVFLVGDPMQSIYRFRKAEVGLFLRAKEEGLGDLPLVFLRLKSNFRAAPQLVQFINAQGSAFFPQDEDPWSGKIKYSPATAVQESIGIVEHHLDEAISQSCDRLIATLRGILVAHPTDKIAILVRARTHAEPVIAALKQATLPYDAGGLDDPRASQLIEDLKSLTFALMHPDDRLSWLALLRFPETQFNLADLLKIAQLSVSGTVWATLQNPATLSALSKAGQSQLSQLLDSLTPAMTEKGYFMTRLEQAWYRLWPELTEQEIELCEAYMTQLSATLEQGKFNRLQFNDQLASLKIAMPDSKAQIKIMTIHKAKGLEFDHVLIPALERSPRLEARDLLLMTSSLIQGKTKLLLAPIQGRYEMEAPIYRYLYQLKQEEARQEAKRLLYVALTRAKKGLYLFAVGKRDAAAPKNSFLAELKHH